VPAVGNMNRIMNWNRDAQDNPQWEEQAVTNELVKQYADVKTRADIFRRIKLDERDHINHSLFFVVKRRMLPGIMECRI